MEDNSDDEEGDEDEEMPQAASDEDSDKSDSSDDDSDSHERAVADLEKEAMLIVQAPEKHAQRFLVAEALETPANDKPTCEFSVRWYIAKKEFGLYEPAFDPAMKKKTAWMSNIARVAVMVVFETLNADQSIPKRVRKLFEDDLR